jgi:hypothetical protein
VQLRQQFTEALCNHRFRGEGLSDVNGNRGEMRDATAEAPECEWKRLRLNRASPFVVEKHIYFSRDETGMGSFDSVRLRLTALKMTVNQNCARSVRQAPRCALKMTEN